MRNLYVSILFFICSFLTTSGLFAQSPSGDLTLTLESGNIRCFGEDNGFVNAIVSGGMPPYFYEWSNGSISSSIDSLPPGNYTVTVTDNNGNVSASVLISEPAAPLTVSSIVTHASCGNYTDGAINITAAGGTPPYTYVWNNDSWMEDQSNLGAGAYAVTVTDSKSCHAYREDTVTQPEPIEIITIQDTTICFNQIATIGYSMITGGVAPYDVYWTHHGLDGHTIDVAPQGTTTYGAFVLDSINCASDTSYFTVTVLDSLEFTVTANADTICPNDTVRFRLELNGIIGTTNDVYMNDSLLQSTLVNVTPGEDTIYTFVAWDECHDDSIYIEFPIYTHELPTNLISANITEGCQPLTVHFNEGSPHFGQRYIWDFDDGDVENLSFSKQPTHTFNNATTYHVNLMVESVAGCKTDSTIAITVHPAPDSKMEASRTNIVLTDPIVNFTNYTDGGYFYTWDMGDGAVYNTIHAQHTFTQAGLYKVILEAKSLFNCSDTSEITIKVSNDVLIFAPTAFTPNHDDINEMYTISVSGVDIETYHMYIFDRSGETIFTSDHMDEGWNGRSDFKDSPSGVYTWRLVFDDYYGNTYFRNGTFSLIR